MKRNENLSFIIIRYPRVYRFQKYGVWVVLGNLFRNWPFRGTVVRLVCIANKQKKTILEKYQFMNDSTEIKKNFFRV